MAILKKDSLKNEGFFSIDALFAIIMLLLAVSSLVNIYQGRSQMAQETRINLEGRITSEKIAGAINMIYASEGPLKLKIDLPQDLTGKEYTTDFGDHSVFVENSAAGLSSDLTSAAIIFDRIKKEDKDLSEKIEIYWERDEIWVKNT